MSSIFQLPRMLLLLLVSADSTSGCYSRDRWYCRCDGSYLFKMLLVSPLLLVGFQVSSHIDSDKQTAVRPGENRSLNFSFTSGNVLPKSFIKK